MTQSNPRETYIETVQAVNYANGIVKMFLVGQDLEHLSKGLNPEEQKAELREVIAMPLPGFLYACSVIQSFMQDEKMQAIVQKYKDAGFLPDGEGEQDSQEQAKSAAE